MTTDVVGRDRRRTVVLREAGDAWVAAVDGREIRLHVCRIGDRWSMLIGGEHTGRRGGRSYEVTIERRGGGERVAHVAGHAVSMSLLSPRGSVLFEADRAKLGTQPWRLTVPMPGRVVRLFVRPGDLVTAGQGLVVVEAMKMENEVRAPRAGRVADVRVREGAAVEANAVLLVLE